VISEFERYKILQEELDRVYRALDNHEGDTETLLYERDSLLVKVGALRVRLVKEAKNENHR
jgi:hypothetical protein